MNSVLRDELVAWVSTPQWRDGKTMLKEYYNWTRSTGKITPKPFDLPCWRLNKYYKLLRHETRFNFELFVTAAVARKFDGKGQCGQGCTHLEHRCGKSSMMLDREMELRSEGYTGLDLMTGSFATAQLIFQGCLPFMIRREQEQMVKECQVIEDLDEQGYYYPAFVDDREERLVWSCHKCGRSCLMTHDVHRWWQEQGVKYRCSANRWSNDARSCIMGRHPKRDNGTCDGGIMDLMGPEQVKLTWHRFVNYLEDDIKMIDVLIVGAAVKTIQRNMRLLLKGTLITCGKLLGSPQFYTELSSVVRRRFYAKILQ
tara:strand:+ start:1121 stop:2059 length:939 start_codon:yes stop_codon:yes gene_type:complete